MSMYRLVSRAHISRAFVLLLALAAFTACGGDSSSPSPDGASGQDTSVDNGVPGEDGSTDTPGPTLDEVDCIKVIPLRGYETDPSAVAVLFAVEECETGVPIVGLDQDVDGNFQILENGERISSESHRDILPSRGQRVYVDLVLDLSDSTQPIRSQLVSSAKSFVTGLLSRPRVGERVRIGIRTFDGRATVSTRLLPTNDADELNRVLDRLTTLADADADGAATNLNGAARQAVQDLALRQEQVRSLNEEGVVTTGYVLLFTDGADSAGREEPEAAIEAIASARNVDLGDQSPPVETYAVALRGADYDELGGEQALTALVGERRFLFEAEDAASLEASFVDVANRIAAQIEGTYLLAYCSSKRADTHTVSVRVAPDRFPNGDALEYTFSAAGFSGGCNAAFFETACDDNECGGFNCGACEDATESCVANGPVLQCVDTCIEAGFCDGEALINDLGYARTCDGGGAEIQTCGGECVDTSSDTDHCGACGNACDAEGSRCEEGECVCSDGSSVCGGACGFDLESDEENCGTCGNACEAADSSCVAGSCVCADGSDACGDACGFDLQTDEANCGACGVVCEASGSTCERGACECEDGSDACGASCGFDLQTDDENCGECGLACTGNTLCAGGLCECTPGWGGSECDEPVCTGGCGPSGICIGPDECFENPEGFEFVLIEPGTFTMGSPLDELGRESDESPHEVTLTRGFLMQTTEITQAQWGALSGGTNISRFAECGESCPVENVDWYSAIAFANAVSEQEGLSACYTLTGCSDAANGWRDGVHTGCSGATFVGLGCTGYRLPTEAEWEYAARAGTTTATYGGDLDETSGCVTLSGVTDFAAGTPLADLAWYDCNADRRTHPVASLAPNGWGLYDMLGNVFEWTWDWLGTYAGDVTDPVGPNGGSRRVFRGGSWNGNARYARAAYRLNGAPDYRNLNLGFRLARSAP